MEAGAEARGDGGSRQGGRQVALSGVFRGAGAVEGGRRQGQHGRGDAHDRAARAQNVQMPKNPWDGNEAAYEQCRLAGTPATDANIYGAAAFPGVNMAACNPRLARTDFASDVRKLVRVTPMACQDEAREFVTAATANLSSEKSGHITVTSLDISW